MHQELGAPIQVKTRFSDMHQVAPMIMRLESLNTIVVFVLYVVLYSQLEDHLFVKEMGGLLIENIYISFDLLGQNA